MDAKRSILGNGRPIYLGRETCVRAKPGLQPVSHEWWCVDAPFMRFAGREARAALRGERS